MSEKGYNIFPNKSFDKFLITRQGAGFIVKANSEMKIDLMS